MDSTIATPEDINNLMNKPESPKKTGLGLRLKALREAMPLSEKEAAARLHLNVKYITLLENENFADGPPATFLRGYLRSYARLLNISENEIALTLKALESAIPSSNTAAPILKIQPRKQNERYLHWLTLLIVVILGVLVSTWWSSHSRYTIADVPITQPATPVQPTATTPQNLAKPTPTEIAAKTAPLTTPNNPNPPVAAPAITPPTTAAQLVLPLKAPEPTLSATPETQAPTEATLPKAPKKSVHSAISSMDMALPEPGMDNDE